MALMNIDLRDYTINLDRHRPSFEIGSGEFDLNKILPLLRNGIPAANPGLKYSNSSSPWMPAELSAERLLAMDCSSCHSAENTMGNPVIPFDNPSLVSLLIDRRWKEEVLNRLRSTNVAKQMPLGYPAWTSDEISRVEDYFDRLAAERKRSSK